MLVFRVATPVTTLKLSNPRKHANPHSPFRKRAALTTALADATNSSVTPSDYPLFTTCLLPRALDAPRLPFLTQSLGAYIGDVQEDSNTENPDTCTAHTSPTTYFPVHGPFNLLRCLQNGGFASTWAAKDQSTGRILCLKVFKSLTDLNTKRSVQMELRIFRRMVKFRGGLRGKQFIMELSRSIQHGTTVFFAMELMSTDLGMYLSTEPERCKTHARRWMAQLALGIESLHDMGIIHRDIKPENILIDARENVRIVDFGLSYLDSSVNPLRQGVGYAIEYLGTQPYVAPELLRNKDVPTHRRRYYGIAVDWWALGCVLFELESQGHLLLFDTFEDIHAYIAWTQDPFTSEQTYPRFEGLDPVVVNLLEGLLEVPPSARFSLVDMEEHEYFLREDGVSELNDTASRALDWPMRPELVPQFTNDDEPMEVIEAAKLSSIYDWTNLKWACK